MPSRDAVEEARLLSVRLGEYVGAAYAESVTLGRVDKLAGLLAEATTLSRELHDGLRRALEGPDDGLEL